MSKITIRTVSGEEYIVNKLLKKIVVLRTLKNPGGFIKTECGKQVLSGAVEWYHEEEVVKPAIAPEVIAETVATAQAAEAQEPVTTAVLND